MNKKQLEKIANFKKLTPAQKRVRIAKDVLAQLENGKIVPAAGNYFDFYEILNNLEIEEDSKEQLCDVLNKADNCEVCALGAIFVSAVKRMDKITVDCYSKHNGWGDGERFRKEEILMRIYLRSFFDTSQLRMIENAFEQRHIHNNEKYEELFQISVFMYPKNMGPKSRMQAIMRNIIDNKGEFVLDKDAYMAFEKTKGTVNV